LTVGCESQTTFKNQKLDNTIEVLVIGTSHWNNYTNQGSDVAKPNEIDILDKKYQDELNQIVNEIANFKPTKIFIERTPNRQIEIDSLYRIYKSTNWGDNQRNEIYQLGFRTAKKLNHEKLYCVDNYDYVFPIDSVRTKAKEFGQSNVLLEFNKEIMGFETRYNKLVKEKASLVQVLKHWNSEKEKKANVGLYINVLNKVGSKENFVGSYLTSEWYKRNFNILSNIQRKIVPTDKKIMILMGAGHTSLFEDYIKYIPTWKIVSINEIIE
jgi:hypothetical protein